MWHQSSHCVGCDHRRGRQPPHGRSHAPGPRGATSGEWIAIPPGSDPALQKRCAFGGRTGDTVTRPDDEDGTMGVPDDERRHRSKEHIAPSRVMRRHHDQIGLRGIEDFTFRALPALSEA